MNEVEKMYESAGVEMEFAYLECHRGRSSICCPIEEYEKDDECMGCINSSAMKEVYEYPPFTAEKQLELIKWLSTKELKIRTNKEPYAVYVGVLGNDNTCFYGCEGLYLEQTLSELINHLWQSLTEEERKQIRNILE